MVTSAQLEALDAGHLDVGLMRPHRPHGGFETILFGREALMLAIPQKDAKKWPVAPTLSCLEGRPLISYSPYEANYFHQLVQNHLDRMALSLTSSTTFRRSTRCSRSSTRAWELR
jgi:DNA-binding transcriptional LysR family regulator